MHSPRSWRPAKLGMQVQLNPNAFRRLTLKRGSRVLWEKAARCPCTVMGALEAGDAPMATGEPRSDCPEGCFGLGYLYHHPQEIRAVVLSASKNPVFYQIYGEHAKGMAMVTLLPEHMAKPWDRLTVLDSVHPVTEIRERTGARERLRYPVAEATLDVGAEGNENVKLRRPSNGVYLRRADASGRLVVTAPEQDVDFTINEEGLLVWSEDQNANVPAIGERFSIDYWAHPTYIVNDTPHPHRDNWISAKQSGSVQWARYPIQVHCWLETFGPPHGYGAE